LNPRSTLSSPPIFEALDGTLMPEPAAEAPA
jgi:hypothetical protein